MRKVKAAPNPYGITEVEDPECAECSKAKVNRKDLIERIEPHLSKRYKDLDPSDDKYQLYCGLILDFVMSNTPPSQS